MKNPGMLVETKDGKIGRTFNADPLINGKVKVYLLNEQTFNPKRDNNGVPLKLLCNPSTLKIKGYID